MLTYCFFKAKSSPLEAAWLSALDRPESGLWAASRLAMLAGRPDGNSDGGSTGGGGSWLGAGTFVGVVGGSMPAARSWSNKDEAFEVGAAGIGGGGATAALGGSLWFICGDRIGTPANGGVGVELLC
jgi:hypothetical protein